MSTENEVSQSETALSLEPQDNSNLVVGLTKEDRLQELEADKLFLEKWDQLSTQALYVAVGVFAVLPTVLNALRSPYQVYPAIWVIVVGGLVAVCALGFTKLMN